MRFEQTPNNQLNINFDTQESPMKTKEQIRDEVVDAIIADCEVAKKRVTNSRPVETNLKKIEALVGMGKLPEEVTEVDAEAERRTKAYWEKVYSGIRPQSRPEPRNGGGKNVKITKSFVDYKKMQYIDDVADEELN